MSDETARARHLRKASGRLFADNPPKSLGVAVSGGGDSIALLALVHEASQEGGSQVHAVTIDHGLRPEAAEEAELVAAFCAKHGIPHETLKWDGWDGKGNLQAQARDARYALIAEWARQKKIKVVALGHTQDDQAENFLLRLARASGVDGLATMDREFEARGVKWLRPLLDHSREDLRGYLRHCGIAWRDDPSNEDEKFDRVKARNILHQLAPLGIDTETLARVSHHMSMAKWALEHYTREEAVRLVEVDRGDVVLTRSPFPPVPAEIERRLLNEAIQFVSGGDHPPRHMALIEMDVAFIDTDTHTMSGCLMTLNRPQGILNQKLRISRELNAVKETVCQTDAVWDGRWVMIGPHSDDLQIRALGDAGLRDCPEWRATGLPRRSLLSSPAIWRGDTLVSAPIAGYANGWQAKLGATRGDFAASLIGR